MGFTRTTEGRVFFKGPGSDDGPRFEAATTTPPESAVMNVDQTQMQILLLLKSLNAKLKTSKEEQASMKKQMIAYKTSLKQIRDKTGAYENNYIDLEQQVARKQTEAQKQVTRVEETLKDTLKQLEDARKLVEELESKADGDKETVESLKSAVEERKKEEEKIVKRQKELEKSQAAQGEKMVDHVAAYVALTKRVSESEAKQASLDNKIEDNTSEFLKLDRKIDKAMEDRNRILRKIERIESAVMETRDALNAKAMVLLTQQGNSPTAVDYPQIATDTVPVTAAPDEDIWWKKSLQLNVASLTALLLAVLAIGWLISSIVSARSLPPDTDAQTMRSYRESRAVVPAPPQTDSTRPLDLKTEQSAPIQSQPEAIAWNAQPQTDTQIADQRSPEIVIHKGRSPDETPKAVDLSNEKETLALMDTAPERVAEELNRIEPANYTPATPEKVIETSPLKAAELPPPVIEKQTPEISRNAQEEKSRLTALMKPDKNLTEVAKRIEIQAFEGIPEAQHDMGAIYVAGHGPIKQDLKRAVFWFEEAAQNNVANAQYNLGVLYHQGMGVDKNLDRAIGLYQKASDQGHPEAQYNLGIANIEGIGVPYNPQKAATYFENAANKNIMEAAYNLGLIYENGLLGETHPDEALMWYKTAADNGSPEAKSALEQLANSLGIALSDVNRVVEKTRATKKVTSSPASQQDITGAIQKELMARGLYPGPVDGMNGPMTANAIKTYQTSANLAADGIPTRDLLNYMRAARN